jgi:hypothetical protein
MVDADDIARAAKRDRLGTVVGVLATLGDGQWHEGRGVAVFDTCLLLTAIK